MGALEMPMPAHALTQVMSFSSGLLTVAARGTATTQFSLDNSANVIATSSLTLAASMLQIDLEPIQLKPILYHEIYAGGPGYKPKPNSKQIKLIKPLFPK